MIPSSRKRGRTAAWLSLSLLAHGTALAGCDRRTAPEPQVPAATTPSVTPAPMPDSSASSAMPPASAASQ